MAAMEPATNTNANTDTDVVDGAMKNAQQAVWSGRSGLTDEHEGREVLPQGGRFSVLQHVPDLVDQHIHV